MVRGYRLLSNKFFIKIDILCVCLCDREESKKRVKSGLKAFSLLFKCHKYFFMPRTWQQN